MKEWVAQSASSYLINFGHNPNLFKVLLEIKDKYEYCMVWGSEKRLHMQQQQQHAFSINDDVGKSCFIIYFILCLVEIEWQWLSVGCWEDPLNPTNVDTTPIHNFLSSPYHNYYYILIPHIFNLMWY